MLHAAALLPLLLLLLLLVITAPFAQAQGPWLVRSVRLDRSIETITRTDRLAPTFTPPSPPPHHHPGLDTLIGLQGDGFVLLAADPVLHRSLVVMQTVRIFFGPTTTPTHTPPTHKPLPHQTPQQDRDKLPIVGPRRMLAIGGPPYFVEVLSEILTVSRLSMAWYGGVCVLARPFCV